MWKWQVFEEVAEYPEAKVTTIEVLNKYRHQQYGAFTREATLP